MALALEAASAAASKGEVPVGAVLAADSGEVLAVASNAQITSCDPTAHAEILTLRLGAEKLNNYRLPGCTLYVTLEPCQMCAGALYWSQISKIVYAASDEQRGFKTLGTLLHPKTKVVSGILAEEASALMKRFFIEKRNLN